MQSLSPGTTVSIGNEVTFTLVPNSFSGAVNYSVSDTASGSTVTSSDVNNGAVFVWIPASQDAGTHYITVTASDASGDTASASQSITVNGPPTVSVQSLSPGTAVNVGQTIFFNATASGFTNPIYSVSDSSVSSSLSSSDINSTGGFSWTPRTPDVGGHTITVHVSDQSGDNATATLNITVNPAASMAIQSLAPGSTVSPGTLVTFTAVPTSFINPVLTLTDSFLGGSASQGNISPAGAFVWTPTIYDIGTHTITIRASDATGDSAATSTTILVSSAPAVTLSAVSPSSKVSAGTQILFYAYTTGLTSPNFRVSDSATSSIGSSNISGNGTFTWTPVASDAGVHAITITAADSSGRSASSTASITVQAALATSSVQPVSAPAPTSSAPAYTFTLPLSVGSQNPDVTALQKVLASLGFFSAAPSGYFGPVTSAAVQKFQTAHGIQPLGTVGPATRAALNALQGTSAPATASTSTAASAAYSFTVSLGIGSTGADVTALQKLLVSEGLYSGPVTGYFGALTQTAVKAFQSKNGIDPVGSVGPATRAALNAIH